MYTETTKFKWTLVKLNELPGCKLSQLFNNKIYFFLILNFRHVLIVVSFLLGKSPASVY